MVDPLDDLITDPLELAIETIVDALEGTVVLGFIGMLALYAALASGA